MQSSSVAGAHVVTGATSGAPLSLEQLALRVPRSRRGEASFYIDRALAFRFQPSATLVVSGFWRSGTTWLEEALRDVLYAKTLFEPLCPLAREAQAVHAQDQVAGKSYEYLRMYMPYCASGTLDRPALRELFRKALRSQSWGPWLRRFRKGVSESFRPRLVVKFVRAQLCLRAAQNTFGMPVLHVHRDPRAIIASIKKTRWHWLFDHLSLREQLLEPGDGRAEYFDRWRDDILEYDRGNPVARVAAYWALSERFVREAYADGPHRFVSVSYEALVQERERIFAEILAKLELRPWREGFRVSERDSTTTSKPQRGSSLAERVQGWKRFLSPAEIGAIEAVVQRLGLEDRLVDDHQGFEAMS